MKKIPNVFERDWNGDKSRVLPEWHKDADVQWVLTPEAVPTVKWDGSAVMWDGNELFVRYDWKFNKKTKKKPPMPNGFLPSQEADPKTGHHPGWIPARNNPAAKWHQVALDNYLLFNGVRPKSGATMEACGPHHQTNPYNLKEDFLFTHGQDPIQEMQGLNVIVPDGGDVAEFFEFLRRFLTRFRFHRRPMTDALPIEGIVWHHPDGRMAKALASDLGVPWKEKTR